MPQDSADSAETRCPGKMENIIVLGSEQSYDLFWLKMMFLSPGLGLAQGSLSVPYWTHADRTTVLYVAEGYSRSELLALENLSSVGVHLEAFRSARALTTYINTREIDGERYDILRLLFICHGLPGILDLNYQGGAFIKLNHGTMTAIGPNSFCAHARIYSYACRTGNSKWRESFSSLAQAEPENSLAQRMATHCGVPFHAFYTRTLFAECIRDPNDSDRISAAATRLRVGSEGSILNLSDEHEALPHAGQGTANRYVFFENGQVDEGTSEYSLWRKQGGRAMPVADNTPEGLPGVFAVFEP